MNVPEMTDDVLLSEFMDWTRIYRNEGELSTEDRQHYKNICSELKKRDLLNPKNLFKPTKD